MLYIVFKNFFFFHYYFKRISFYGILIIFLMTILLRDEKLTKKQNKMGLEYCLYKISIIIIKNHKIM